MYGLSFVPVNAGWMRDGQLLERAEVDKIRHIPCTIVQGRYDSVCPATTAWELHKGTGSNVCASLRSHSLTDHRVPIKTPD